MSSNEYEKIVIPDRMVNVSYRTRGTRKLQEVWEGSIVAAYDPHDYEEKVRELLEEPQIITVEDGPFVYVGLGQMYLKGYSMERQEDGTEMWMADILSQFKTGPYCVCFQFGDGAHIPEIEGLALCSDA